MDAVYAKIRQETSKFNLGDEEDWRKLYEPLPTTTSKSCRVIKDQRYGPARRNLLDVYVPTDDDNTKKAVLLFMHGGGFFSGDKAWSEKYWGNIGHYFASQGIIVVIANHQLVYFEDYKRSNPGYSVDEETSARYPGGADDVQLAREWIYENIGTATYGHGDCNKVVLFGHSSGGAHIAMNLYAQGDPDRSTTTNSVYPPVAGVIYLSVPFHFDGTRPIRRKILEKYYGSVEESVWGPKTPLSLLKNLPEGSHVLDAMAVPHYIGTVKWEVKEASDAAVAFFAAYRERSQPTGTHSVFHVVDKHNHISNVLSIGSSDTSQSLPLLQFIKTCTETRSTVPGSRSFAG